MHDAFDALVASVTATLRPLLPGLLVRCQVLTVMPDPTPEALVAPHCVEDVVAVLERTLTLGRAHLLAPSMTGQLFASVFHFMDGELFNALIACPALFRWDQGLILRFNVTVLCDWAMRHGLRGRSMDRMVHSTQASKLLQMSKSSSRDLGPICRTCDRLNSLQRAELLCQYNEQDDEEAVPRDLIACVRAQAGECIVVRE